MPLSVIIAYCHPALNFTVYQPMARRFVQTYMQHPPGEYPHQIVVLVNGSKYPALNQVFSPLPVLYFQHNNSGRDIGAYQIAAENLKCDLLVCLGSPVHFHKTGWLDRIVEVYLENGPALYGCWAFHVPAPHIRTTAFWMPPELFNAYPFLIGDSQRYEFEHGSNSITLWAQRAGYRTFMVTWSSVLDMPQWTHATRDQSLMIDQHAERDNLQ